MDIVFAMKEASLYCDLVNLFKNNAPKYGKLFEDIRLAIDTIHSDGSLKSIITRNLSTYIESHADIALTLHKLRSAGKKLFLLTNSHWDYTESMMSFLLDGDLAEYPEWERYFEAIIVGAKKPSFFISNEPFVELDRSGQSLPDAVTHLGKGRIYEGG